jgi:cytochrome P450
MSIPEILCQISTFLAAGNDTTASALCWTLYALSVSPLSQSRLRSALQTICPSSSADELFADIQSLPYLDWVVRESLRIHSPATSTMRVCMKDADIIPTADTWIGRDGVERSGIEVQKGDIITVPIQTVNKSKRIWGEDAGSFRWVVWILATDFSLSWGGL